MLGALLTPASTATAAPPLPPCTDVYGSLPTAPKPDGGWTSDCKLYEIGKNARASEGYKNAVRGLQRSLKYCNRQPQVTVDGWFGPQTRKALIAVQKNTGAYVDGWYGPDTRKKMPRLLYVSYSGGKFYSICT
ncbi:MAG: peptidoglycan-binding domain-containing protein [Beutenbergiaceae bacterium]